jgi:putative ABC transport system permease protein
VAQRTGLHIGSIYNSYHGLVYDENMQHEERFEVVGIIAPTNGPMDRVLWVPIDSIYRMKGHELHGAGRTYIPQEGEAIPDADKEVSAVMLKFRSPAAAFQLDGIINRQGKVATLAWPIARIVADLFEKMGWVSRVLTLVAYLIVVVAAGSILARIYNSMNERRREFAILRALGARRRIILSSVVLEAAAIALAGAVLAFAVYAVLMGLAALVIRSQTGIVLEVWAYHPIVLAEPVLQPLLHGHLINVLSYLAGEAYRTNPVLVVMVLTPLAMVLLGAAAGLVPATKAYMTDVAANLAPLS